MKKAALKEFLDEKAQQYEQLQFWIRTPFKFHINTNVSKTLN